MSDFRAEVRRIILDTLNHGTDDWSPTPIDDAEVWADALMHNLEASDAFVLADNRPKQRVIRSHWDLYGRTS